MNKFSWRCLSTICYFKRNKGYTTLAKVLQDNYNRQWLDQIISDHFLIFVSKWLNTVQNCLQWTKYSSNLFT